MLNPALYNLLRHKFGEVRIQNENQRRTEEQLNGQTVVLSHGETYSVDCPMCGDKHKRLTINYMWLEKPFMRTERITNLAHCFNEECKVWHEDFWRPLLDDLEMAKLITLPERLQTLEPTPVVTQVQLPTGCIELKDLPADHEAIRFAVNKYPGLSIEQFYERTVMYTAQADPRYRLSAFRLIWPIVENNLLVAWQGRTTRDIEPRWYLPPGMPKTLYNFDKVPATEVPVLCEGIPAAMACGPNGVALFGKSITDRQLKQIVDRTKTVLICLDPDAFVNDAKNRIGAAYIMQNKLQKHGVTAKLIKWPQDALDHAAKYVAKQVGNKYDPADFGTTLMEQLINSSLC